MSTSKPASAASSIEVNLKNATLAAVLAWLWPGAGHLYQGRTAKGLLYMICILGTFFFGMWLGDGKVVYASWRPNDVRLAYLCQVGAGLPALPALVQARRTSLGMAPFFGGFMAPPKLPSDKPMRPDDGPANQLAEWHKTLHRYFELGTVYTMVAGLLNILAIYDALDGPALLDEEQETPASGDDKKPPEPGNE